MSLLLRSCVLMKRKLFAQEVVLFRHFVTFPKYSNNLKKFVPSVQVKYFSIDKDNGQERELLYIGELQKRIRNVKVFSIVSTIASLIGQPFLFMKAAHNDNLLSLGIIYALFNLIVLSSPILIHMMTKRYVLKLYYCPREKNYVAIVYRFFLQRKEVVFTADDVTPPKRFKGTLTSCFAKDYPLFVDPQHFPDIRHYNIIMGYNKPSDFEVEPLNVTPINRIPNVSQSLQIEDKVKKIN